jgi:hypothetical protein
MGEPTLLKSISAACLVAMFCMLAPSIVRAQGTVPAAGAAAENPAVTAAAKTFYSELLLGKVDRSKMSADLNAALTDSTLQTLSQQLIAVGPPSWQFVEQTSTPNGPASVYKLSYASAVLYMTYGVSEAGTIYSVFLGNQAPAAK